MGQMNLEGIPPFDPMHLSRISLPADQKQTLKIKKPRASQYGGPVVPPNPEPATPKQNPTPPPVAITSAAEYDEPEQPKLKQDMDDLDAMLNDLESGNSFNPTPNPTPQSRQTTNLPTTKPSAPVNVQANKRTPNSPVTHRNAPPKWND